ncbi:MAG: AraC family transcriptional regulator [Vicinamibacterales bacterium]
MDVLTDVLQAIRVRSVVSGRLECTAPWGLGIPGGHPTFYLVTRGTCWLSLDQAGGPAASPRTVQIDGGDFVVLPRGQGHAILDSPATPVRPVVEVLTSCPRKQKCQPGGIFRYGGDDGATTTLVWGCFEVETGAYDPLLLSLPPLIHVRGDQGTTVRWLEATMQFVASEMASGLPGAETVVSRLADILFVQAIRAHLAEAGSDAGGWLRALMDPQVGAALSLIHETPEAPWTVESLAQRIGLSRSAFAARFADLVGEPPLTYITRWRMGQAARMLRAGSAPIGEIAQRVGYEAEAAFNKAFKRWNGVPPGVFRRRLVQADAR